VISESLPTSELAVVGDEVLPVELDAAPVVVVVEVNADVDVVP